MEEGTRSGQPAGAQAKRVKRIWAHEVQVGAAALQVKLNAIQAGIELTPREAAIAEGVQGRLDAANAATIRRDPIPGRVSNWWRGTLVETSFQNLHAAEALMVPLYSSDVVEAEIPEAVARVEATLNRDDPRRLSALKLLTDPASPAPARREMLRKSVEVGFGAADTEHTRLRSFRNAVVGGTVVLTIVLSCFIIFVAKNPTAVSYCFSPDATELACPAGGDGPTWQDVVVIALLGMLGGLLSGIVSIRNLAGTSIAYNVPQALAWLKLPLGALSAVGGLIVVRGEFVPGLTDLDSSDQVLAYAFAFGVAQQLLIGLVDKQAQVLLAGAPGKATSASHPERGPSLVPVPPQPVGVEAQAGPDPGAATIARQRGGNRVQRALRELRTPSGGSTPGAPAHPRDDR